MMQVEHRSHLRRPGATAGPARAACHLAACAAAFACAAALLTRPADAGITGGPVTIDSIYNVWALAASPSEFNTSGMFSKPMWWGDKGTAQSICERVGNALGFGNQGGNNGPYFAWRTATSNGRDVFGYWTFHSVQYFCYENAGEIPVNSTDEVTFAYQVNMPVANITSNATSVIAGAAIAADSTYSTCFTDPCVTTWLLACPENVNTSKTGSPAVVITTGSVGTDIPINASSGPVTCELELTLSDSLNQTSASTIILTVNLPPGPLAVVGGVNQTTYTLLNISAGQAAPLDASPSQCASEPCRYAWDVLCNNGAAYNNSSASPVSTPIAGPGAAIDVPSNETTSCNVSLQVSDAYSQVSSNTFPAILLVNAVSLLEPSPSPSPGASPSPSPEASPSPSPEALPSPSPLQLDCSRATFNVPILLSRLRGQICAANKAVRQGKPSKLVTSVTLSLMAANNQPAAVNITNIITNKLTAGWQCGCRPTNRDNCTCLPNAMLLGGGNFLVSPQWRRSTVAGRVVDTTLQVSFTASDSSGGTCNGTAVICSAWGVRRNQPPPTCTPFNSTGVTRPALTCI